MIALLICSNTNIYGQMAGEEKPKKWFESVNLRGYAQARYNRLFETNSQLKCKQCDRSWGDNGGFFMRRIRLIFSGQISQRVYFYIQPDFASNASSTSLHFGQIRDAYFDLGLDKENTFRVRVGQSKVPFGFENMQSSQNRLPLDRADALNSAVSNERDMGAFFYWAPAAQRKLFADLVRDGLKGSGDYGIVGFGLYNGQTANRPEANNNRHKVIRLTWPFQSGDQIIETSIQAYSGKYTFSKDQLSTGVKANPQLTYIDQRAAASFILYPKPLGIQAEYNIGRGPQFDKLSDSVSTMPLSGGYVTLSHFNKLSKGKILIPFTRYHFYDGGKKHELDARSYSVRELEIGFEWQPVKQFELVLMYTISARRFEDYIKQENLQKGRLLRVQAQINF
ncbi:MAG: porin [Bacteroidetes bacterium]|nr:porin [Bacteroidota bacterium]